ncbi:E3 ubiquitin-protein ligase, partial [Tetrabaena socialis]
AGGHSGAAPAASGPAPDLPDEWAALFRSASHQDVPSEAPSQFTCPLTMEIFRDPVVTPSGRTYERSALLEHMKK